MFLSRYHGKKIIDRNEYLLFSKQTLTTLKTQNTHLRKHCFENGKRKFKNIFPFENQCIPPKSKESSSVTYSKNQNPNSLYILLRPCVTDDLPSHKLDASSQTLVPKTQMTCHPTSSYDNDYVTK